jgi:hypothetical protein
MPWLAVGSGRAGAAGGRTRGVQSGRMG